MSGAQAIAQMMLIFFGIIAAGIWIVVAIDPANGMPVLVARWAGTATLIAAFVWALYVVVFR